MTTIQNKLQKISKSIGRVLLNGKQCWTKTIFGISLSYTAPGTSFPSQPGMLVLRKGTTIFLRSHRVGAGCPLCESGDLDEYEKETLRIIKEISAELRKESGLTATPTSSH